MPDASENLLGQPEAKGTRFPRLNLVQVAAQRKAIGSNELGYGKCPWWSWRPMTARRAEGEEEDLHVVPHSLPPHSIYVILQARILEWIAFPFSRGSSQLRDQTQTSHIAGRFFTNWAIGEAQHEEREVKK